MLDNVPFNDPAALDAPAGYDIIQQLDVEEANRGFDSDEETLLNDDDW